jgi:hypothetical protein
MRIMLGGGVALVAAALCAGLGVPAAGERPVQEADRAVRAMPLNRVADTVLRKGRYDYQRQNWRVREADGLPAWLRLRDGRLAGTAPRLGRWRIELEERGVRKQRGEVRRTTLVLRSVAPRAATGTVLVTRGRGGRPANEDSRDVTLSGDGSTVVFSSRATNLVLGTEEPVGRLYVWDTASQRVSLLHPEHWAVLKGISHDGQRALVQLTAGLFLVDRADGSVIRVAERAVGAALAADGERVLYQDRGNELASPEPRLLEWTRATGETRTVAEQLGTRTLVGQSADGRFAVLGDLYSSQVLDTTTGTHADLGLLGIEGGSVTWLDISDDGRLVSVRGTGLPGGSGSSGRPFALVHDTVRGWRRGPLGNTGTAITADGTHYAVATATRHLRVVEAATGDRTSPFAARPSGQETWASLSDDVTRVAYVSDGHDLLPGTRRGVANVYVWVRPR